MNLPWNGCLSVPNIVMTLRAIGVPEPPLDPVANVGQIHGYSNALVQMMKNRITGVKSTLKKAMTTNNNGNLVNQTIAPVAQAAQAAQQQVAQQQAAQQQVAAAQQQAAAAAAQLAQSQQAARQAQD